MHFVLFHLRSCNDHRMCSDTLTLATSALVDFVIFMCPFWSALILACATRDWHTIITQPAICARANINLFVSSSSSHFVSMRSRTQQTRHRIKLRVFHFRANDLFFFCQRRASHRMTYGCKLHKLGVCSCAMDYMHFHVSDQCRRTCESSSIAQRHFCRWLFIEIGIDAVPSRVQFLSFEKSKRWILVCSSVCFSDIVNELEKHPPKTTSTAGDCKPIFGRHSRIPINVSCRKEGERLRNATWNLLKRVLLLYFVEILRSSGI